MSSVLPLFIPVGIDVEADVTVTIAVAAEVAVRVDVALALAVAEVIDMAMEMLYYQSMELPHSFPAFTASRFIYEQRS